MQGAVAQLEERHNLWGLVFEWNLTSVTSPHLF